MADSKTPMTPGAASRIQSHADRTGTNQDFKSRAQSGADKNTADLLSRGDEDDRQKVSQLFLTVLSRLPTESETTTALAHLAAEEKPHARFQSLGGRYGARAKPSKILLA